MYASSGRTAGTTRIAAHYYETHLVARARLRDLTRALNAFPLRRFQIQCRDVIEIATGKTRATVAAEDVHARANQRGGMATTRHRALRPVALEHNLTVSLGLRRARVGLAPFIRRRVQKPHVIVPNARASKPTKHDNLGPPYHSGVVGARLRPTPRALHLAPVKLIGTHVQFVQLRVGARRAAEIVPAKHICIVAHNCHGVPTALRRCVAPALGLRPHHFRGALHGCGDELNQSGPCLGCVRQCFVYHFRFRCFEEEEARGREKNRHTHTPQHGHNNNT